VLVPTILVLSGLVLAFVVFATYYSDWLWFGSVDKTSVFATTFMTQIGLFLVWCAHGRRVGADCGIAPDRPAFGRVTAEQASLERYRASVEPYRLAITIGLSALMGVMTGLSASAEWGTFSCGERAEFGQTDAQFAWTSGSSSSSCRGCGSCLAGSCGAVPVPDHRRGGAVPVRRNPTAG
jgi:hypothetical protein